MTLEASSSETLLNFLLYDTNTSPTLFPSETNMIDHNSTTFPQDRLRIAASESSSSLQTQWTEFNPVLAERGRKRRRKKPRVCKNKEEAETQRLTHIAVERNRRKQINEHLAVLRSLMPESYAQKGDQASIVGGAIEFIKKLEHFLQSLEAQKLQLAEQRNQGTSQTSFSNLEPNIRPSSNLFLYPILDNNKTALRSSTNDSMADMDVTLIETHANIKIMFKRRRKCSLISKLVAALHSLCLFVLHLNVTTMETSILYSISAKVEESCQLSSVEDIASAVHHVLRVIEESMLCSTSTSLPEKKPLILS